MWAKAFEHFAGNAGLSDLVAALNMLNNILPAFGADPSSLTLLGWESGASLVILWRFTTYNNYNY